MGLDFKFAVATGIYSLFAIGGSIYKLNDINYQRSEINRDPLIQKHDSLSTVLGGISVAKEFFDSNLDHEVNSYRNSLNRLENDLSADLKNIGSSNEIETKLELRKDLSESNGLYNFVFMTGLLSLWLCIGSVNDHYRFKRLGLN